MSYGNNKIKFLRNKIVKVSKGSKIFKNIIALVWDKTCLIRNEVMYFNVDILDLMKILIFFIDNS